MKVKKNIKENFKQIALTMFAIMLIGVGYINFSMQTENQRKLAVENKANIGDVELVNSSNVEDTTSEVNAQSEEIEEYAIEEEYVEEEIDQVSEYFNNSKLERDKM